MFDEQIRDLKRSLQERPMPEAELFLKILTIRNTAVLQMNTYSKYSHQGHSAEQDDELADKIKTIQENADEHLKEYME